jgi:DNA-directed RNA polymerase specialized sigma24 family protein
LALPDSNLADTVARARQLDPVALGQIYDRYFAQLFRYAQFRLGEDGQARTASEQVFSLWLETQVRRPSSASNLDNWFFDAIQKAVDQALSQSNPSEQGEQANSAAQTENSSQAQKDESAWLSQLVSQSLRRLLIDQQHLLALRFAGPYTIEEIARLSGKSIVEVKGTQYDALVALRKLLETEA